MPMVDALYAVDVGDAARSLTVGASSTRLPINTIRGQPIIQKVELTVETAQIRWWDDGTDPTASVGQVANVGTRIVLANRNRIENFRAIRTGSTSATLRGVYLA